jgi:exodeoxyribonuclease-5
MIPQPCTVHSAFGLKPKRGLPNEPEAFREGPVRLQLGDLIIVDECSMVGSELYRLITEKAEAHECRVLFTGDPKQLQPVNERRVSKTFGVETQWALTEVLRHGGPVLDLATKVRSMPRGTLPRVRSQVADSSSVVAYSGVEALEDTWGRTLKASPNDVVFLCWTNKLRRTLNKKAREILYGKDVPDYQEDDKLLVLRAFERGGQIVMHNNQEVRVKEATLTKVKPLGNKDLEYECWYIKSYSSGSFYVLTDAEVKKYKADVQAIGKEVKADNDKLKHEYETVVSLLPNLSRRELWNNPNVREVQQRAEVAKARWSSEYFALKDFFAEVDFSYAVTIHKSQGSTFNQVFIADDYMQARDERLQLLYVAVTRAAKAVHHCEM